MELLQLTYFCDAAESQNFSHTAQKFLVPPSNISQSIKRLETELSVQLFDRTANRIVLNAQGQAFYQKVKSALALLEDARSEAADRSDSGVIRLSILTNRRIVMQTVEAFRQHYPHVDIITAHNIQPDLDKYHLIVSDETFGDRGLRREKLLEEDFFLAISAHSKLAGKAVITPDDLQSIPFISMQTGSSLHSMMLKICKNWGIHPHIAIQSDDPFYIRKCVELDLGITIIPSVSWRGQLSEGILLRKIDGFQRNTYVYWDEKKYLPRCAKVFLSMLVDAFRTEAAADKQQNGI